MWEDNDYSINLEGSVIILDNGQNMPDVFEPNESIRETRNYYSMW